MGKFLAYARVSTSRQGEKGVSLPEQKSAIERYASLHGLAITRWFEERESAARTGRPAFMQMLRLLRNGSAQGVIIHKIDRSARNLEDWADVGRLADAGVEVHFANENVDLKTVAGRLSADIQAVVAAHYSRNLREEVKKGFYGRLKQGYYPLPAPIGYLNRGAAKPKIHDPFRGPLVREAFSLYASGKYSLPQLTVEMFRRGLRNHKGGKVPMSSLADTLRNAFYVGLIRIKRTGETFKGNHEPLVTTEIFKQVQSVLAGKRADRAENHVFVYSRFVRCGTCGYSLVAERQKGHVYYRCHDRLFKVPPHCPRTSLREEQLDRAVVTCLADVELSDAELNFARTAIEQHRKDFTAKRDVTANALRLQIEQTKSRIEKLTDLLIEGAVEKSLFDERKTAILFEQVRLKERLAEVEQGEVVVFEQLEHAVELAKNPSLLYKRASVDKKRELLQILLSNLTVSSQNIEITLAPTFRLIANRKKPLDGGPYRGTCRTWHRMLGKLLEHFKNNPAPVH